jgi:hypothetical protein
MKFSRYIIAVVFALSVLRYKYLFDKNNRVASCGKSNGTAETN